MKLEIKSKYSLMYDQLTLFLSTKSSILLQLLQHTKKIIAFLSIWFIILRSQKIERKMAKVFSFSFRISFLLLQFTFVEVLANNIDRWTSLKWPNRTSIRGTGESAKNRENRRFGHGERLDFRLVIEKAGLIVQRWKLISKIQLAAASLSRDLLSMRLDFGRNRWQLRGRSW